MLVYWLEAFLNQRNHPQRPQRRMKKKRTTTYGVAERFALLASLLLVFIPLTASARCIGRPIVNEPLIMVVSGKEEAGYEWAWTMSPDTQSSQIETLEATLQAPLLLEFSADSGLTWSSDPSTCPSLDGSIMAQSKVKFKRSDQSQRMQVSKRAQNDQELLSNATIERRNGEFKWLMDSQKLTFDHFGTWKVTITHDSDLLVAFDLIITSSCQKSLEPKDTEVHLTYIWPMQDQILAKFGSDYKSFKSTVQNISDSDCQKIRDRSLLEEKTIFLTEDKLLQSVEFKAFIANDELQVLANPTQAADSPIDRLLSQAKNGVSVLALLDYDGIHVPLKLKIYIQHCADLLEIDSTRPPDLGQVSPWGRQRIIFESQSPSEGLKQSSAPQSESMTFPLQARASSLPLVSQEQLLRQCPSTSYEITCQAFLSDATSAPTEILHMDTQSGGTLPKSHLHSGVRFKASDRLISWTDLCQVSKAQEVPLDSHARKETDKLTQSVQEKPLSLAAGVRRQLYNCRPNIRCENYGDSEDVYTFRASNAEPDFSIDGCPNGPRYIEESHTTQVQSLEFYGFQFSSNSDLSGVCQDRAHCINSGGLSSVSITPSSCTGQFDRTITKDLYTYKMFYPQDELWLLGTKIISLTWTCRGGIGTVALDCEFTETNVWDEDDEPTIKTNYSYQKVTEVLFPGLVTTAYQDKTHLLLKETSIDENCVVVEETLTQECFDSFKVTSGQSFIANTYFSKTLKKKDLFEQDKQVKFWHVILDTDDTIIKAKGWIIENKRNVCAKDVFGDSIVQKNKHWHSVDQLTQDSWAGSLVSRDMTQVIDYMPWSDNVGTVLPGFVPNNDHPLGLKISECPDIQVSFLNPTIVDKNGSPIEGLQISPSGMLELQNESQLTTVIPGDDEDARLIYIQVEVKISQASDVNEIYLHDSITVERMLGKCTISEQTPTLNKTFWDNFLNPEPYLLIKEMTTSGFEIDFSQQKLVDISTIGGLCDGDLEIVYLPGLNAAFDLSKLEHERKITSNDNMLDQESDVIFFLSISLQIGENYQGFDIDISKTMNFNFVSLKNPDYLKLDVKVDNTYQFIEQASISSTQEPQLNMAVYASHQYKFKRDTTEQIERRPCLNQQCSQPSTYLQGESFDIGDSFLQAQLVVKPSNQAIYPRNQEKDDLRIGAVETDCGPWLLEDASKTKSHIIEVYDVENTALKTEFEVLCEFAECKNEIALTLGDIKPWLKSGNIQHVDTAIYYVFKEQIAIKLQKIYLFCLHTPVLEIKSANLIKQNGSYKGLKITELSSYGIQMLENELVVYAEDDTLYNSIFELTIEAYSKEERTWKNTTHVKITYLEPPCNVTQADIDEVGRGVFVSLNATRGLTKDEKSIAYIMDLANKAFRTDERTFCGQMQQKLFDEAEEQPFVNVDFENQLITLAPHLSHEVGTFESASLRFYFDRYPHLSIDFPIQSTFEACILTSVEFTTQLTQVEYVLGEAGQKVALPALQVEPKCSIDPQIASYSVSTIEAPEGVDPELLYEFSEQDSVLVLKQTDNLQLLNETISIKVQLLTEDGFPLEAYFNIDYISNGPSFVDDDYTINPFSCSKKDRGWSYSLSKLVAEEQQIIETLFLQEQEYANILVYYQQNRTLTLASNFEAKISNGEECPSQSSFNFEIKILSSKLGVSTFEFSIEIKPEPTKDKEITFSKYNVTTARIQNGQKDDSSTQKVSEKPSVSLAPISDDYLVVLTFSEPINPITKLREIKKSKSLQVFVQPLEGQEDSDVEFEWETKSFVETELQLQLTFTSPYKISLDSAEPNQVEITFNESTLFTRQIDGKAIEIGTSLFQDLPAYMNSAVKKAIESIGLSVQAAGKSYVVLFFILGLILNFSANSVLSSVRSLQLITHFMMLQLNYPPVSQVFFGKMFEFVNFDILPTDLIYGAAFNYDSDPISERAEEIGYESGLFIENSGSFLIYVVLISLTQLVFYLIVKFMAKSRRIYSMAVSKREQFFWEGAIDFFNELYLNMCMSAGINLSNQDFETFAVGFNTIFAGLNSFVIIVCPIIISVTLFFKIGTMSNDLFKEEEEEEEALEGGEGEDQQLQIVEEHQRSRPQEEEEKDQMSQEEIKALHIDFQVSEERVDPINNEWNGSQEEAKGQVKEEEKSPIEIVNSKKENEEIVSQQQEQIEPVIVLDERTGLPIKQWRTVKRLCYEFKVMSHEQVKAEHRHLKSKIDEIALEHAQEQLIKKEYGMIAGSMRSQSQMKVQYMVYFVNSYYNRRLVVAVVILTLTVSPCLQIISLVILEVTYFAFLFGLKPYASPVDQRQENINELSCLMTLYCLTLMSGQYLNNGELSQQLGFFLITLVLIGMLANFIPILSNVKFSIRRKFAERKQRKALKEIQKKLQARTKAQILYNHNLEYRVELAEENQIVIPLYINKVATGALNNEQAARRIQKLYDEERALDTDFKEAKAEREAQQAENDEFESDWDSDLDSDSQEEEEEKVVIIDCLPNPAAQETRIEESKTHSLLLDDSTIDVINDRQTPPTSVLIDTSGSSKVKLQTNKKKPKKPEMKKRPIPGIILREEGPVELGEGIFIAAELTPRENLPEAFQEVLQGQRQKYMAQYSPRHVPNKKYQRDAVKNGEISLPWSKPEVTTPSFAAKSGRQFVYHRQMKEEKKMTSKSFVSADISEEMEHDYLVEARMRRDRKERDIKFLDQAVESYIKDESEKIQKRIDELEQNMKEEYLYQLSMKQYERLQLEFKVNERDALQNCLVHLQKISKMELTSRTDTNYRTARDESLYEFALQWNRKIPPVP